jgi:hypothetical protein
MAVRHEADQRLTAIAREAWEWAATVREPTRRVASRAGTRLVLGVEEDVRSPQSVREARQVISLLLADRRPRGARGDLTRHWAIWRMMNALLDWSELDDSPGGVVFPYPTRHAAAVAVVEGFRRAELDSSLTSARVLRHYERHFQNR